MLPSPGFSIPSIGTPLHQPEEDQQIMTSALQQQMPPLAPMGASPSMGVFGSAMPSIMTPSRPIHTYAPGFVTPQSMMQPQTPVCPDLY